MYIDRVVLVLAHGTPRPRLPPSALCGCPLLCGFPRSMDFHADPFSCHFLFLVSCLGPQVPGRRVRVPFVDTTAGASVRHDGLPLGTAGIPHSRGGGSRRRIRTGGAQVIRGKQWRSWRERWGGLGGQVPQGSVSRAAQHLPLRSVSVVLEVLSISKPSSNLVGLGMLWYGSMTWYGMRPMVCRLFGP